MSIATPRSNLEDRAVEKDKDAFLYPGHIYAFPSEVNNFVLFQTKKGFWTLCGEQGAAVEIVTGGFIKNLHFEPSSSIDERVILRKSWGAHYSHLNVPKMDSHDLILSPNS